MELKGGPEAGGRDGIKSQSKENKVTGLGEHEHAIQVSQASSLGRCPPHFPGVKKGAVGACNLALFPQVMGYGAAFLTCFKERHESTVELPHLANTNTGCPIKFEFQMNNK